MAGNGLSERLQTPISTAELERRWGLVRATMKREGVDVLLMQNNNDHMAATSNGSRHAGRPTAIQYGGLPG